jgi:hypothetical protein
MFYFGVTTCLLTNKCNNIPDKRRRMLQVAVSEFDAEDGKER